jgi:hypothetical protein
MGVGGSYSTGKAILSYSLTALLLVSGTVFAQGGNLNVKVQVPNKYKDVHAGSDLVIEFSIMNLRAEKRVDVEVEYLVRDPGGSIIVSQKDTVAVETKASFVKTLRIPTAASAGRYIVSAEVNVLGSENRASSQASFIVSRRPETVADTALNILDRHMHWMTKAMTLFLTLYILYRLRAGERIRGYLRRSEIHSLVRKRLGR